MDAVPQTKNQWVSFLAFVLIEFLLGKTNIGSTLNLIWATLKLGVGFLLSPFKKEKL